jgi:anti-sigma factor RsiW
MAALVYQRRQHFINLFIWPEVVERGGKIGLVARQGYNLIYWHRAGMAYWAVSDLVVKLLRIKVRANRFLLSQITDDERNESA